MKKWNEENISNNKEHDAVFSDAGITREQVWIQHSPQQQNQDFAVASYETNGPEHIQSISYIQGTLGFKISRTFEKCTWIRYCAISTSD